MPPKEARCAAQLPGRKGQIEELREKFDIGHATLEIELADGGHSSRFISDEQEPTVPMTSRFACKLATRHDRWIGAVRTTEGSG